MFIVFEGADAAGKHTQSERLKKHYEGLGVPVQKFDFPRYATISGQIVLGHLTGDWHASLTETASTRSYDAGRPVYHGDVGTYLFQCAHLVNKMEALPDEVWEGRKDRVFIADRYIASAYAYGRAFDLDFDWLLRTHKRLPQPDLNIYLDISIDESFKRRPDRRDQYERDRAMLERVRSCYHEVFNKLGPTFVIVDAMADVDEVTARIMRTIQERVDPAVKVGHCV